jgi:hypothetical protein
MAEIEPGSPGFALLDGRCSLGKSVGAFALPASAPIFKNESNPNPSLGDLSSLGRG